jgi:hypothetical protein
LELISFRGAPPLQIPDYLASGRQPARVELADGASVLVRTVRLAPGSDPQLIWEELRRLAEVGGGWLARPLAASIGAGSVTIAEEVPNGASLRVLRRLVPLTFDQAAMIGDGLLAAVAALERRQLRHRAISLDTVFIGAADGRVRLVAPDPRPATGSDLERAAGLARELLEATADAGHRAVPAAARDSLLELLRLQLGRSGTVRVRRQLQALAARLEQPQRVVTRPPAAPARPQADSTAAVPGAAAIAPTTEVPSRPVEAGLDAVASSEEVVRDAAPPPPSRDAGHRPVSGPAKIAVPRSAGRGWLGAAVVILLLLAAGGTSLVLRGTLQHRPAAGTRTARPTPVQPTPTAPSPSPSAVTTPRPSPSSTPAPLREIPLLGPASNPPVTNVELSASCPPSGYGGCTLTVTANLGSHQADTVGWLVDLVNRCTGAVSEVASGDIPAPAEYTYVEAQPEVEVPSTTPVGLVALAGAPNLAASPPLLITPPGSTCPG